MGTACCLGEAVSRYQMTLSGTVCCTEVRALFGMSIPSATYRTVTHLSLSLVGCELKLRMTLIDLYISSTWCRGWSIRGSQ